MNRIAGGLGVMLVLSGVTACREAESVSPRTAGQPIAVDVATVAATNTSERLEAGGVVAAQESATVSSRIVAPVVSVHVRAGDRVRAGDVLVRLDSHDITAQTQQVRATAAAMEKSLLRARAEHGAAEADHQLAVVWQKRITALHARQSATDQERDEAETRLTAAAARLAAADAAIAVAEAQVTTARSGIGAATATESFAVLRAPFTGLVTERLVDPGTLAAPGVPLLRVESDGARQVLVRVDEARAADVRQGDTVRVEVDRAGGASSLSVVDGTVAEVARAVGVDQRAFTVKVTVPALVARSGSFARVIFSGPPRRALLVPATAVRRHGQVSTVFVVQDGLARLRLVQTGVASGDTVEILTGAEAGETIVTSHPAGLADGNAVTTGTRSKTAGGRS